MFPDTSVSRPLTAVPSPETLALKHQQSAAKAVPASGESSLLRKFRQQENKREREKAAAGVDVKVKKDGVGNSRDLCGVAAEATGTAAASVASDASSELLTPRTLAFLRNKARSVVLVC